MFNVNLDDPVGQLGVYHHVQLLQIDQVDLGVPVIRDFHFSQSFLGLLGLQEHQEVLVVLADL